ACGKSLSGGGGDRTAARTIFQSRCAVNIFMWGVAGDLRYNSAVFSLSDVRLCKDNDKIADLSNQSLQFFT
ncbi:hypothetical protein, partial [Paramuribaculum intestinale]|uniref:hypothetical protein n=1 Tax=Paramuribaculum intestinale TaxID=2094151 RepID=UPI0025B65495